MAAAAAGVPPPQVEFADVGCGFGGLTIRLAEAYPDKLIMAMELRDKVTGGAWGPPPAPEQATGAKRSVGSQGAACRLAVHSMDAGLEAATFSPPLRCMLRGARAAAAAVQPPPMPRRGCHAAAAACHACALTAAAAAS